MYVLNLSCSLLIALSYSETGFVNRGPVNEGKWNVGYDKLQGNKNNTNISKKQLQKYVL
jgi:hypothetical protein